jgi:hypothetical protein
VVFWKHPWAFSRPLWSSDLVAAAQSLTEQAFYLVTATKIAVLA